jgi:hypothetical protein
MYGWLVGAGSSSVLIGTKRIDGLLTALAIASGAMNRFRWFLQSALHIPRALVRASRYTQDAAMAAMSTFTNHPTR